MSPTSRSEGANPSGTVISSTTSRIFARRPSRFMSPCDCSEKIADRISLIVSSRASTALLTRSATSGRAIIGTAPCSDIPVA